MAMRFEDYQGAPQSSPHSYYDGNLIGGAGGEVWMARGSEWVCVESTTDAARVELQEAYHRGVAAGAQAMLGYLERSLAPVAPHQERLFDDWARAADALGTPREKPGAG